MKDKLSAKQQRIFNAFHKFDFDVAIAHLYAVAFGGSAADTREMQQKLGPYITRINKKLKAGQIKPGDLKQTYRLVRLEH